MISDVEPQSEHIKTGRKAVAYTKLWTTSSHGDSLDFLRAILSVCIRRSEIEWMQTSMTSIPPMFDKCVDIVLNRWIIKTVITVQLN